MMLSILVAVSLGQSIDIRNDGVPLGWGRTLDCVGDGVECALNTTTRVITLRVDAGTSSSGVASADGGTAAPLGAPFVTWRTDTTLPESKQVTQGKYIWVDAGVSGLVSFNFATGLSCGVANVLALDAYDDLTCASTIAAADSLSANGANCATNTAAGGVGATGAAEACVGSSGTPIEYASNAYSLVSNPSDCAANTAAVGVNASGTAESCVGSSGTPIDYATRLAANGSNCSAGWCASGVDQLGQAETCIEIPTVPTIASATPTAVGDATAAVGTATKYAREDHDHAHGDIAAGSSMHQAVTASTSGFMTAEMLALLNACVADAAALCAAHPGTCP